MKRSSPEFGYETFDIPGARMAMDTALRTPPKRTPPTRKPRGFFVMDSQYDDPDLAAADPIERVCAILREAKMSGTNIAAVRGQIARMLESSAKQAASPTPTTAMDSAYHLRFPQAGRLAR